MYRQHQDASAGSEQPYSFSAGSSQFSAGSSQFNYSPFNSGMAGIIDPGFQSSPHHLSPRPVLQRQATHRRHLSADSQVVARAPSRSLSPRLTNAIPVRNANSPFTPRDRALPSKDITAETIVRLSITITTVQSRHTIYILYITGSTWLVLPPLLTMPSSADISICLCIDRHLRCLHSVLQPKFLRRCRHYNAQKQFSDPA